MACWDFLRVLDKGWNIRFGGVSSGQRAKQWNGEAVSE